MAVEVAAEEVAKRLDYKDGMKDLESCLPRMERVFTMAVYPGLLTR